MATVVLNGRGSGLEVAATIKFFPPEAWTRATRRLERDAAVTKQGVTPVPTVFFLPAPTVSMLPSAADAPRDSLIMDSGD